MNLFARKPTNKRQRERWLVLLNLVENNRLTSIEEIQGEMSKRGFTVSEPTALKDVRCCNISKIDGVYTIIPYTIQSVVEEILKARMRAAVISIYHQNDLVILNTNRGAGTWLGAALRELEDDHMVSFNDSDDGVWILASEGNGDTVYNRLNSLLMKARV